MCYVVHSGNLSSLGELNITMLIFDKVMEIQGLSISVSENNIFC